MILHSAILLTEIQKILITPFKMTLLLMARTVIALKVDELQDYKFPSRVIMENIQTGHSSIIEFTQLVVEDIPDRYFTQYYLQNR